MTVAVQRGIIANLEIFEIEGPRGSSANASFNFQGFRKKYAFMGLPSYCADYLDDSLLDGDEVVLAYKPEKSDCDEQQSPSPIILMKNLRNESNFGQGGLLPAVFSMIFPLGSLIICLQLYFSNGVHRAPTMAYFGIIAVAFAFFAVVMSIAIERFRSETMIKSTASK